MKIKILGIVSAIAIIHSCASKPAPPPPVIAPEVKNIEATASVSVALVNPADILQGKTLYENNCGRCHKLFSPTDFNMVEWKPIMASMQKKAGISDADASIVMVYIASEQK